MRERYTPSRVLHCKALMSPLLPGLAAPLDFTALVKTHQGVIRAFLNRLCRNQALADDLAQDTFMQAHGRIDQLQNPDAARAWLFQIAYNTYAGHARKEGRRRELRETQMEAQETQSEPNSGLAMDIERAMAELPNDMRAAVMLCLSYGMSHGEAAAALSLPLGTVKSHVTRGRAKLQAILAAYQRV